MLEASGVAPAVAVVDALGVVAVVPVLGALGDAATATGLEATVLWMVATGLADALLSVVPAALGDAAGLEVAALPAAASGLAVPALAIALGLADATAAAGVGTAASVGAAEVPVAGTVAPPHPLRANARQNRAVPTLKGRFTPEFLPNGALKSAGAVPSLCTRYATDVASVADGHPASPDRDALHRLLADVRRWIEAGAVEIRLERTRGGGYRVLGTTTEPPTETGSPTEKNGVPRRC